MINYTKMRAINLLLLLLSGRIVAEVMQKMLAVLLLTHLLIDGATACVEQLLRGLTEAIERGTIHDTHSNRPGHDGAHC